MALFLTLGIGDRLVLTDQKTGDVTLIEIDNARGARAGRVRLRTDAPRHVRIEREHLDDRVAGDKRALAESEPVAQALDGTVIGGDRVKIFESKKGNTVVFVEDPRTDDGGRATYKRTTYQKDGRVSRKGEAKGKLYFVLKDQVVIHGTDALAQGAQRMMPRGRELLSAAIARAIPGGPGSGGTS